METQRYYRPANQETADYLEHCLGRKSAYARSQTLRVGHEASEGRSKQGIPLMRSQEIKQLADEDVIGFHRQFLPFKATRMDWRGAPLLVERRQIPAPVLPMLQPVDHTRRERPWQVRRMFPPTYIDPDTLD